MAQTQEKKKKAETEPTRANDPKVLTSPLKSDDIMTPTTKTAKKTTTPKQKVTTPSKPPPNITTF